MIDYSGRNIHEQSADVDLNDGQKSEYPEANAEPASSSAVAPDDAAPADTAHSTARDSYLNLYLQESLPLDG